jgi:hypothetical protein
MVGVCVVWGLGVGETSVDGASEFCADVGVDDSLMRDMFTGIGADAIPVAPTNGMTGGNVDCAPTPKGMNVKRQSMRDALYAPIRYLKERREVFIGV